MSCSTSFIAVLVAALLITTLSYCSAESVYCVTPSANLCSSCPHNSTHCATLSEYAREAELYFTSNTTMVFLPGDHILDTNITVANVAGLMMRGESSSGTIAIVVCKGQVGWDFTSMVDFKIHALSFTSCNRKHGLVSATLLLQSTQNAELVNCSFHDNLGTALAVDNTKVTLSGKSEFIHNHCERCIAGGIVAFNSSNLTFTGNTTFLENQGGAIYNPSHGYGGGVYAFQNTTLTFCGTTNFVNNSAGYGGAIYALVNTVFSFHATPTSSATQQTIMVVQSMQYEILYLISLESPTSSTTQRTVALVVQSSHQIILQLVLVEPVTLSATQQNGVVQST